MKIKRDTTLDIIKGILIILVVVGHSGAFYNYIYLFHMAAFFIISGYCYKETYNQSLKSLQELLLKKIKRLYIPFVCINSLFLIL